MTTKFADMSKEEQAKKFEEWRAKRLVKSTEAPAKRKAMAELKKRYEDEYKELYAKFLAEIKGGSGGKKK